MNIPLDGYTIWDNHPDFPVEDWMHEVSNDDTRLGYWEWVRAKIEQNDWDDEEVQDV
uniref:Uncharacterized protein n=1 Tax=viral metagenome TaxID=1070528 RepID=A0A6M3LT21_9ZZZZ